MNPFFLHNNEISKSILKDMIGRWVEVKPAYLGSYIAFTNPQSRPYQTEP